MLHLRNVEDSRKEVEIGFLRDVACSRNVVSSPGNDGFRSNVFPSSVICNRVGKEFLKNDAAFENRKRAFPVPENGTVLKGGDLFPSDFKKAVLAVPETVEKDFVENGRQSAVLKFPVRFPAVKVAQKACRGWNVAVWKAGKDEGDFRKVKVSLPVEEKRNGGPNFSRNGRDVPVFVEERCQERNFGDAPERVS